MYCFFVLNIFLINFTYFTYSFDQNHSCYENFCFIRNCSDPCPYPYQPLELLSNKSWQAFKQVINKNREEFYNNFIYLDLTISSESWEWIDGVSFDNFNGTIHKQTEKEKRLACLNSSKLEARYYNETTNGFFCQSCEEDKANCFHIIRGESKTWYEAFNDCFERGMRLASFKDNIIPKTVLNRVNEENICYWVGLYRNGLKWKYSNKMLNLSFWQDGYPKVIENGHYYLDSKSFLWVVSLQKKKFDIVWMKEINKEDEPNNVKLKYKKTFQKGLVIGLPIAILFIIIIILIIIIFYQRYKIKSEKKSRKEKSPKNNTNFANSSDSLEYQNETRTPGEIISYDASSDYQNTKY